MEARFLIQARPTTPEAGRAVCVAHRLRVATIPTGTSPARTVPVAPIPPTIDRRNITVMNLDRDTIVHFLRTMVSTNRPSSRG
jgi:hypothetical protein